MINTAIRCYTLLGIIVTFSTVIVVISCNGEKTVDPFDPLVPQNVWIEINGDCASTNDTLLTVTTGAENAAFMQLGENADLAGVVWSPFDSLLIYPAPRREGCFTLYCRFASVAGGTTEVISDDIDLDFSATITSVEVFALNDTLFSGDQIEFNMITGENGVACVSFGDVITGYRLNWIGDGRFRRLLTLPDGILNQSVTAVGRFTDAVGNVADSLSGEQRFVLIGPAFNPRIISTLNISCFVLDDIWYSGGYCFISDWGRAIHIVDVTRAETPAYVDSIVTADWTQGMDGNDDLLIAADSHGGLVVIGTSPPQHAAVIGREPVGGLPKDVVIDGDYVYAATYTTGLRILDITDPSDIYEISRYPTAANCVTICKNDTLVYVGGIGGFSIVNVREPENPTFVGEFLYESELVSILYDEQRIFAATDRLGVLAIDVSDPGQPELIASHPRLHHASALTKKVPFLFVNRGDHVSVVNITDPHFLPEIDVITGLDAGLGIYATNRYLYVVGYTHLTVVEMFPQL